MSELKINFNAGPAALPQVVLEEAAQAILNYNNAGLSILSLPHRGKDFDAILEESKLLVRELCGIGEEYEILWLQGGGRLQFAMAPMNFLGADETAGYIDSGSWSSAAISYANYYGKVKVLSSSKQQKYTSLPQWPKNEDQKDLAYIHCTTNNTIYGTQWKDVPATSVPLIADMSSDIFSRKVSFSNCDMFYAVAQKNIGPAGATLVVVRKDFLKNIKRAIPSILDYNIYAQKNSVLNTPPVFAIYTSMLVLRWIKNRGLDAIEKDNQRKAAILYKEVERNSLFRTEVKVEDRSMMNVCFLPVDELMKQPFVDFCEERNITGISGHRSVGGFRVSLYNAITIKDVEQLITVMQEFEQKNK